MMNFDNGIQMYELEFAVLIFAGTTHSAHICVKITHTWNWKAQDMHMIRFIVITGLAGSLATSSLEFQFKMVHNAW